MLLMTPKVGDVTFESGFENCGWFSALKNSTRSFSRAASRGRAMGTVRNSPFTQAPVSCARSALMPNTFAVFVAAIVSAVPDWIVAMPSSAQLPITARAGPPDGPGINQFALTMKRCVRSKLARPQR